MRRSVKLDLCGHVIVTSGDRVQPIEIGQLRWCGVCACWRKIQAVGYPLDNQCLSDVLDEPSLQLGEREQTVLRAILPDLLARAEALEDDYRRKHDEEMALMLSVYALRQLGLSFREIGRRLSTSHERTRQLFLRMEAVKPSLSTGERVD